MFKRILLSIDLTQESSWRKALPEAIDYAKAAGGTLHVMTVVPDFGMSVVAGYFPEDFGDKAQEDARGKLSAFCDEHVTGIEVECTVGYGIVYEEILRIAEESGSDLIIMASHRPELSDYLIGPNASRVVRHAKCSVLVIRE